MTARCCLLKYPHSACHTLFLRLNELEINEALCGWTVSSPDSKGSENPPHTLMSGLWPKFWEISTWTREAGRVRPKFTGAYDDCC
ncbi:hypothetical protein NPIL_501951 [Nephila pilipes]|uniref:Uncharacterized protein n=1 Tax=Nephila pilipes TaxID=299642 RepID=A0A8X6NUZ4_NEPPI|nr:hypothetical protein NPIL_501951 [Nephila pilipes]